MPIIEPPNVKNFERKYTFTSIEWITSDEFETIESNSEINPVLRGIDEQKTYVGKAIVESDYRNPEVIGIVMKNIGGNWQLNVPYAAGVKIFTDDFLVLNIRDKNAFKWIETEKSNIPKHALRGSLDVAANEFLYIGRTINAANYPKGRYLNQGWKTLDETLPSCFGKVHGN